MNKFTDEQIIELKNLKSIDELNSFLTKENITLTIEETAIAAKYFESDKSELTDDELDMVTGGDDKGYEYKRQAFAEGRTIPITTLDRINNHFCDCFIEQAWAKSYSVYKENGGSLYDIVDFFDCKCYRCGRQQDVHRIRHFL